MKRILLLALTIALTASLSSQPWNTLLPKEKVKNNTVTFFDYQKAFNDYWQPYNIDRGYYLKDGERVKAGGWKQFKRWEWYWESRVNPTTGEFPKVSLFSELKKIQSQQSLSKSPTGQWTTLGPDNSPGGYAGLGRLNCIGFHPTDNNTFYAGAASGGVWKSIDGGSNWLPISDNLGAIGISDIIVQATTGDDVVIIATGDRDHSDTYSVGVVISTDGGATWLPTSLAFTPDQHIIINRLLVDPLDDDIFYAATNDGVYKSTDGAYNWTSVYNTTFKDMEFKPGSSNIIYGSTTQGEIYKTIDNGINWTNVHSSSGKRTELAVSANDPDVVYAVSANSSNGLYAIYKSTNSGESFTSVYNSLNLLGWACDGNDSGGQGWYDLAIAADPNNADIVYVGGVNTWKSTDGGTSFTINTHWSGSCSGTATTVHADKHNLTFQNNSSTLFECNDGGLYNTNNGGSTWNHLTNGMIIGQIYRLGVAQTSSDDVIAGLQDNGTKALLDNTWNDVIGGDGMECIIDYSNENTQYGSLYYGSIKRTTDHWFSSTSISDNISGNAAWVTPYVQDPNNSNTLFVGYQDVWKSTDKGNNWTQLSSWSGSTLRSLAVAPSNSDYIYAATTNTLYKTTDGGTSWSNITGSLPTGSSSISYISVSDSDPNTIWIAMGSFNNYNVFVSENGGSSWTDISAGLPTLPTNCVIQNTQNTTETELYAGTDVGVYVKLGNANWTMFSNNLPNVVVNELEIYYDVNPENSLLRAATFGRGLWESDLYSATTILGADFYASTTNLEVGQSTVFTDISTGSPISWEWTFEGGTPGTFTGQNPPAITYDTEGTFDVVLIVSDGINSDTETKTDYITVTNCSVSTFPWTEDFENAGNIPTCWSEQYITNNVDWQYITGNGGSNPSAAHSGTYNACFKDESTSDDKTMLVTPPMDFTGHTSAQISFWHTQELWPSDQDELRVYYKVDGSSAWVEIAAYTENIATWTKDSITLPNLSSTYYIGFEGNALYGYGICVDDVEVSIVTDFITADFEADPVYGEPPLVVTFTDLSTSSATINSWSWDFGDGLTSTEQNPVHTYNNQGTYSVTLTVSGSAGSDTEIKTDYITTEYPEPTAEFIGTPETGMAPLTVTFNDQSVDSVNSWSWDFGDGGTSSLQHPVYIYNTPGIYTVSLTVSGPGGSNTNTKTDYIQVNQGLITADFSANPTNGEAPLLVQFTDLSTSSADINSWNWDFGDGESTDVQNPTHEYLSAGNFTVSLTITGDAGTDTETKTDYILIPVGINDNASEAIIVYPNPVKDILYLEFPVKEKWNISISNLNGIILFTKSINAEKTEVDMKDLENGTYIITISNEGYYESIKIIK